MKLYDISYTISILFVRHAELYNQYLIFLAHAELCNQYFICLAHADFEYIQHTNVVLINRV
jgi:hypothetical protein